MVKTDFAVRIDSITIEEINEIRRDVIVFRQQGGRLETVRRMILAEHLLRIALYGLQEIAGNHGRCEAGHVRIARTSLAEIDKLRKEDNE